MNFLDTCRKFLSIDSTQSNSVCDLVSFIEEQCSTEGFSFEVQTEARDGLEEKNIIVSLSNSPAEKEHVALITHLDTPDPGISALWTKTQSNPFNASIYQDEIYGLGSADSKLDFLCKLQALKAVKAEKLSVAPVVIGTFGFHSSMMGIKKLLRKQILRPKMSLVGAPTNLNLIHASYGFAKVEITVPFTEEEMAYHAQHDLMASSSTQSKIFYGQPGYALQPKLGENAIVSMLDYIAQLPHGIAIMDVDGGVSYNTAPDSAVLELDLVGDFKEKTIGYKLKEILTAIRGVESEFVKYPSPGFSPTVSSLNIGKIKKHGDHIRLMGCCHITPSVNFGVYESWINALKSASKSAGATFRVVDYIRPFVTEEDSELVDRAKAATEKSGLDSQLQKSANITEASLLKKAGVESLVFGPGIGAGNACEPNEKVSLADLEKATSFYKNFLLGFKQ